MPTVRISGNWRNIHKMEWAGAPALEKGNHIERALPLPEEAYQAIEHELARGGIEGTVYLRDGTRFDWFVDR